MRIVQFAPDAIPAEYPANFKRTKYYADLGLYIGDYYGSDDSLVDFAGEIPAEPTGIRIISTGSFRSRFPSSVRKWMRESTEDAVIDLREDLDGAMYIDLDDEKTVNGVMALNSAGYNQMTDEQIANQLKDGTAKEQYNGPL